VPVHVQRFSQGRDVNESRVTVCFLTSRERHEWSV